MALCGYLKQSTTVTITLGPFVDKGDADTEETGLTIADTTVYLSKNGSGKANPNDTNDCTEDANGVYRKQLNATDTNTLGLLTVYVHESGALYIRQDYQVVTSNWYDSMNSTDTLQADVTAISGSTDAADGLEASALTIVPGTVNTDNVSSTTTTFQADDITEATADHFNGRIVIFYDSGDALFRQAAAILDYSWDSSNNEAVFTVPALTEAPSNNDKFVIV